MLDKYGHPVKRYTSGGGPCGCLCTACRVGAAGALRVALPAAPTSQPPPLLAALFCPELPYHDLELDVYNELVKLYEPS